MRTAMYPGSFDPMTLGHLDIVERAASFMDQVIVVVMINPSKNPLLTLEERTDLIKKSVAHLPNVQVDSFQGLLVEYVKSNNIQVIVKGLRTVSDFEGELQMAQMNKKLYPDAETIWIPTNHRFAFVSSSLVKDVVRHGGQVSDLVPCPVLEVLRTKYPHLS